MTQYKRQRTFHSQLLQPHNLHTAQTPRTCAIELAAKQLSIKAPKHVAPSVGHKFHRQFLPMRTSIKPFVLSALQPANPCVALRFITRNAKKPPRMVILEGKGGGRMVIIGAPECS